MLREDKQLQSGIDFSNSITVDLQRKPYIEVN
jgi:hypothetical protein